jgi:hypothetical protein
MTAQHIERYFKIMPSSKEGSMSVISGVTILATSIAASVSLHTSARSPYFKDVKSGLLAEVGEEVRVIQLSVYF